MTDDYLWDRSGDVDHEVERLEQALAPLAYRGRPLGRVMPTRAVRPSLWWRAGVPLALAASVVFFVGPLWFSPRVTPDTWVLESWPGGVVGGAPAAAPVSAGHWVQTNEGGRATLRAPAIGTVDIGPGSRLRIIAAGPGRHLLELRQGAIEATVTAAPGVFSVDTPAARAVDLGCRYTLEVGPTGAGLLHVTLGWVGLTYQGRESLVPAGAFCATRAAGGPGIPYFEGAAPAFVEALATLETEEPSTRDQALSTLLAASRPVDALTLWHLLTRLDTPSSSRVYETLATLAPPSARVTRERVLAGDQAALAAWWEDIGLGDIEVLRRGMARMK